MLTYNFFFAKTLRNFFTRLYFFIDEINLDQPEIYCNYDILKYRLQNFDTRKIVWSILSLFIFFIFSCSSPERTNYFPSKCLTVEEMDNEQQYFRQKLRRHNRFLHGWGVICGLHVSSPENPDSEKPSQVIISEGFAIDPLGEEIYVPESIKLDLADCKSETNTDSCEPGLINANSPSAEVELFIAIKYINCVSQPVKAMFSGCAREEVCKNTRISDSFEIKCLDRHPDSYLPETGRKSQFEVINDESIPNHRHLTDPWVVLAKVTLPLSDSTFITNNNIENINFGENMIRKQVYSTVVPQDQLIKYKIDCEEIFNTTH